MSKHTQVAKLIRTELKALKITAKVKSELNAVTINLETAKPAKPATVATVKGITKKYQCGSFNAEIDLYETTNLNPELPQVAYINVFNNLGDDIYQKALDFAHTHYNEPKTLLDDVVKNSHIDRLMQNLVSNTFGYGEAFWASI